MSKGVNARRKFNCGYGELLWLTTADKYVAFLVKYYDVPFKKYMKLVRFNFHLPNCRVHFIHTIKDPFVIFDLNHVLYKEMRKENKCSIKHHFIDEISHGTLIQSHPEIQMEFLNKCIKA